MTASPDLAYKLMDSSEWADALEAGHYEGSTVDLADGYIHMSAAPQLRETARRHYAGRSGLVLLTVMTKPLGTALVWEPSRGGVLFPHLYGSLPVDAVNGVRALLVTDDGFMNFEDGGIAP